MALKCVKDVRDPLGKVFRRCPRCESTTIIFTTTMRNLSAVPRIVRCPKYLGGCGWRMTREKCVDLYGELKEVTP